MPTLAESEVVTLVKGLLVDSVSNLFKTDVALRFSEKDPSPNYLKVSL